MKDCQKKAKSLGQNSLTLEMKLQVDTFCKALGTHANKKRELLAVMFGIEKVHLYIFGLRKPWSNLTVSHLRLSILKANCTRSHHSFYTVVQTEP